MTIENSSAVPAPRDNDPLVSAGLEIAMKWGQALGSPEQLKIALEALEPQLQREHQIRMKQLDMQAVKAEHEARDKRDKRQHRFKTVSLIVGAVLSVAMLGAGVYVAKDAWWLATLLCGPSLIGMALVIILRRHDSAAIKAVADAARRSTSAAGQTLTPPLS
ncbi:hypothetical protein IM697_10610 [Streptomyces ferrugineus]|uniref:DUF2335 domain-containing protein n=1 Tax=Streptomyces ferrugineus TaxID=1413221 RepID=A0A7M2SR99_9ACTN|nr:hypothetical protein [Streptomyces ferrugineus]QOV38782.1 hypothetical protein IM697_10610 [Streptomyces ferrugineus]